jgi:phosphate-selective porin OprO/OprP
MKRLSRKLTVFWVLASLYSSTVWGQDNADSAKLKSLEQDVAILKRLQEIKKEEDANKAKDTVSVTANEKDGFQIKTSDNSFKLKVRGLVQADGRVFNDNSKTSGNVGSFLVRRARIIFDGTVANKFNFFLMPDFGNGTAQLTDAYLEYAYFPAAKFKAGKFKAPLGLERLQTDSVSNFIELGPTGNLTPNRDIGFQLSGDLFKGTLSYAAGVFNGSVDGGSTDADINSDKDAIVRIFSHPFKNTEISFLQGLGFGIAGSYGHREGNVLPTYRSAGQNSIFTYTKDTLADGANTRISPQLYHYYKSFGLIAEYVSSSQEWSRVEAAVPATGTTAAIPAKTVLGSYKNTAWQASAIYVLTGEDATFNGVKPKKPFSFEKGNWGAFALSARVGRLNIDNDTFTEGFASSKTSVSTATNIGLGLSWFLNNNLRVNLNYERTNFDKGATTGDRKAENVFLFRFQVSY